MRSMSGPRSRDPILADIQRAFAEGYMPRPIGQNRKSVKELYAMVSELAQGERRRILAREGPKYLQSGRLLKMVG